MKILLLSTIFFSFYHIQNTDAQFETVSDLLIYFNLTGVTDKDVLFSLYTRETKDKPQKLVVNDTELLKQSSFKSSRSTKFIVHGWKANGTDDVSIEPMQAYLSHDDYNVIIVDWSTFANGNYIIAATHVKPVGQYLSEMVNFLEREGNNIKQMSLVGHSLGAHVVGLAGHELSPKVAHIVGLDPASVGFFFSGAGGRIHHTDADHVEIVHTNAGWLGLPYTIGDVDYWPNGGARQPGCGIYSSSRCSHLRAFSFFAEAIENSDSLYGIQCDYYFQFVTGLCINNKITLFPMSEPVPDKPKGNYMLVTGSSSPYGLGRDGTKSPGLLG